MAWIIENKEWIFSGIGVAIIGFFITKTFLNKQKMESNNNSKTENRTTNNTFNGEINGPVITEGSTVNGPIEVTILKGIKKEDFSRARSEDFKERGQSEVRAWGQKMAANQGWDWHALDRAIDYYVDAIKRDPKHQHPWTNLAYVFHLIGQKQRAQECLTKAKSLASPGPNYPGNNYKRTARAINNNSYLTNQSIVDRPAMPQWFKEKNNKYLSAEHKIEN